MELSEAEKCHNFRGIIQRRSYGLQKHSVARSTIEKAFRQVFNIRGEH